MDERAELVLAADDFRSLVGTRNNLVHAKPCTAADGAQALFRHGEQWTLAELEGAADAFTACSSAEPRIARASEWEPEVGHLALNMVFAIERPHWSADQRELLR